MTTFLEPPIGAAVTPDTNYGTSPTAWTNVANVTDGDPATFAQSATTAIHDSTVRYQALGHRTAQAALIGFEWHVNFIGAGDPLLVGYLQTAPGTTVATINLTAATGGYARGLFGGTRLTYNAPVYITFRVPLNSGGMQAQINEFRFIWAAPDATVVDG